MAELVALSAASMQFIDIGLRTCIAISRLCSDVKNAPRMIQTTSQNLRQLMELVRTIQSDISLLQIGQASTLSGVVSQGDLVTIISLVQACGQQATRLEETLQKTELKADDNKLKKTWRAVITLKKESEIMHCCRQLEESKSSLSLWYESRTFLLQRKQLDIANSIQNNTRDLVQKVEPVGRQLNLLTSGVQDVSGQIPGMRTTMQRIEATISPLSSELSELKSGATQTQAALSATNNTLNTLLVHFDNSLVNFSSYHQAAQASSTKSIENSIARILEDTAQIRRQLLTPSGHPDDFAGEQDLLAQIQTRHGRRAIKNQHQAPILCNCRPTRSRLQRSWLSTVLWYDKWKDHQPSCHLYRYARTSRSLRARMRLPRFLARVLELTVTAKSGGGDFRLSPSFEVIRVVDRATSPAFALFKVEELVRSRCCVPKLKGLWGVIYCSFEWDEEDAIEIEMFLDNLYQNLFHQFSIGQSSALDQDEQGVTLLHEVVHLAIKLFSLQHRLRGSFSKLVQLLANSGVDKYAPSPDGYGYGDGDGGGFSNALGALTSPPWYRNPIKKLDEPDENIIDRIFLENGWDMPDSIFIRRPGPIEIGALGRWHIKTFRWCPALALEQGYSPITSAILDRSEEALRRLLKQGYHADGSSHDPMRPLAFSIGWPVGMNLLLDAGADPLGAVFFAIEYQDTVATTLILERGCQLFFRRAGIEAEPFRTDNNVRDSIFFPGYWIGYGTESLLQYASHFCEHNQEIMDILVHRLLKDRRIIKELAMRELSKHEQRSLGLHLVSEDDVLDENVLGVWQALRRRNVYLPSYLWPGGQFGNSVYHSIRRVQAADTLYVMGFHSVDISNSDGETPLYQACGPWETTTKWEFIKWLLDKGAVGCRANLRGSRSCLLQLAETFASRFANSSQSWDDSIAQRLSDQCSPMCTDDCRCFCSSYGCTPVHYASMSRWSFEKPGWLDFAQLESWLQHTGVTFIQREVCYTEACRFEIFYRLGMAHVCCCSRRPLSGADKLEMQEEDSELKGIQDTYLQLYKDLRREHSGSLSSFWDAWWTVMDDFLPREDCDSRSGPRAPNIDETASDLPRFVQSEHDSDEINELNDDASADGSTSGSFHAAQVENDSDEANEPNHGLSSPSGLLDSGMTWTHMGTSSLMPDRESFVNAMRSLLGYKDAEDPGDVFSDSLAVLFKD